MEQKKRMVSRGSGAAIGAICAAVLLALTLGVALWGSLGMIDTQTASQGAHTLRDSIQDAAVQCYAIEGQYPASVEYLEENYGISVNHDDYDIIYEVYAENVPPTVEVRAKANE